MKIGNYEFNGSKYALRKPADILDEILNKEGGGYFLDILTQYSSGWDCIVLDGEYVLENNLIKYNLSDDIKDELIDTYGEEAFLFMGIIESTAINMTADTFNLLKNNQNAQSYIFFHGETIEFKTFICSSPEAASLGEYSDFFEYMQIDSYRRLENIANNAIGNYQFAKDTDQNPFEVATDIIDKVYFGYEEANILIFENEESGATGADMGPFE